MDALQFCGVIESTGYRDRDEAHLQDSPLYSSPHSIHFINEWVWMSEHGLRSGRLR